MEQSGEGVTSSDLHNDGLMPERAVQDDEEDILAQQRCHTTAQTNKKRGTVSHAIGERIPDTDLQSATAQSLQEVCTVEDFYRVLWRNQKKEPWEKRGLGSCAKTAVKTVMKTMGPMLIFLALALVVAVTYNYFAVLAPIALGTFSIKVRVLQTLTLLICLAQHVQGIETLFLSIFGCSGGLPPSLASFCCLDYCSITSHARGHFL